MNILYPLYGELLEFETWGGVIAVRTLLMVFRLYALALSVIATATWLGGCHTPVLYQNR